MIGNITFHVNLVLTYSVITSTFFQLKLFRYNHDHEAYYYAAQPFMTASRLILHLSAVLLIGLFDLSHAMLTIQSGSLNGTTIPTAQFYKKGEESELGALLSYPVFDLAMYRALLSM